jgi:hypothetical protein
MPLQRIQGFKATTAKTIASNSITPAATDSHLITLSPSSGSFDTLKYIDDTNLVDGAFYRLVASAGNRIAIAHAAAGAAGNQRNIALADGVQRDLFGSQSLLVYKNGTAFYEATSWAQPNLASSFDPRQWCLSQSAPVTTNTLNSTGYVVLGASLASSTVGADSNGYYLRATTSTVSGNVAALLGAPTLVAGAKQVHHFKIRPASGNVTSQRIWAGIFAANPGALDTLASVGAGFRFSTAAGDTTWKCCAFGSAQTLVDSGITVTDATVYQLTIDLRTAGHVLFYINGVLVADVTTGTGIPSGTTLCLPSCGITTATTATRSLDFFKYYSEIQQ